MGRKTRKAIRAFQAKKGLPITGELSKKLEVAIRAAKRTKSSYAVDLKAYQAAVDAEIWATAMRQCRPLAGRESEGLSALSSGVDWLWGKLCRNIKFSC